MPTRPRISTGNLVFHVLNRAIQGVTVFECPSDYRLFCEALTEALERVPLRLLAYALMPNHWHLVVWPQGDGDLSAFMHWLTATHAKRWRKSKGTHGRGAVYQGRFKAIAVQHDGHLLRLIRYVERNAVRAKLVARAEDWSWCSAASLATASGRPPLTPWPIDRPTDWLDKLNEPEPAGTLLKVRTALRTGRHYGSPSWRLRTARALRWRSGLRLPGRPVASTTDWR